MHALHARVADVGAAVLDRPELTQIWGPRHSSYAVAEVDRWVFTLGRLPRAAAAAGRAATLAEGLRAHLGDGWTLQRDVAAAMGVHPNALRYAAPTGVVDIRWEGSGPVSVRLRDAPDVDPEAARLELARRHLRVLGPATVDDLATWAGVGLVDARRTHAALRDELVEVRTPIGGAVALGSEVDALLAPVPDPEDEAPARLLPSGDAYWLHQGAQRELLVADAARRAQLWPSRVWPGAILARGEIVGTWRRQDEVVRLRPWVVLDDAMAADVEREAAALPLPGAAGALTVRWETGPVS